MKTKFTCKNRVKQCKSLWLVRSDSYFERFDCSNYDSTEVFPQFIAVSCWWSNTCNLQRYELNINKTPRILFEKKCKNEKCMSFRSYDWARVFFSLCWVQPRILSAIVNSLNFVQLHSAVHITSCLKFMNGLWSLA